MDCLRRLFSQRDGCLFRLFTSKHVAGKGPRMPDRIASILRDAADRAIVPRFRRLGTSEIIEKSPGELVTAADRECERIVTDALLTAFPDSRVIGEEACAEAPELLDRLDDGRIWLLDPVDGTANFAAGRRPFAVMLALLEEGRCVRSWMLDPMDGRLCYAELAGGAWIDGSRVSVSADVPEAQTGALISHLMTPELQQTIRARLNHIEIVPKLLCAGEEYPAIARGDRQASLFWRTLPWDHVPGSLFLTEAGGFVSRLDGSAYLPADIEGQGLLVAQTPAIGETIVSLLQDQKRTREAVPRYCGS